MFGGPIRGSLSRAAVVRDITRTVHPKAVLALAF
jgi:hypothetical protein